MRPTPARAFSLIGMLVSMVCIVILFAIGMNALSKAKGGANQQVLPNSVSSFNDEMVLYSLFQSLDVGAQQYRDHFITPSAVAHSKDITLDTTANLFSAMVMLDYVSPEKLISKAEKNWNVVAADHYNFNAADPGTGVFWDKTFVADLDKQSNVSFAHMPLFGERLKKYWEPQSSSSFPILGNRGPKGGVIVPSSKTIDTTGQWAGFMVFGDGHVAFCNSFILNGLSFERSGKSTPDNIFALEDGEAGKDAIITFTKQMTEDGPLIQHD